MIHGVGRRMLVVFFLSLLFHMVLLSSSGYASDGPVLDSLSIPISLSIPVFLAAEFDAAPLSFTLDPDNAPSDTAFLQVDVGTNDPPTTFSIALFSNAAGPDFSYRLTKEGAVPLLWKEIPVLPTVSSQELPDLGWTRYSLDLRVTAGPDLSAGSYQRDVELWFQTVGIIQIYTLHLDITVLGRAPVVDAGPDQAVNEGDVVAFAGSFVDPDDGETYTIVWDFGYGTGAGGTLTPTHTYVDNGTYIATLTVTDSGGRSGQDTLTIVVNDLGPTANVEGVPPVTPPLTVVVDTGEDAVFDASASMSNPDAIVSYEWDWDYGSLAGFTPWGDTGKMGIHVFPEASTYTIAMRVTDDDGSTDIATLEVVVNSVTTTEVSLATPEAAGGGGTAVSEVAIDELYIHHESLAVSQFHLATVGVPEQPSSPVIYFPFGEGVGRYIYNEIDRQSGKEPVLKGTLSQTEWIEGEPACGNAFALNLGESGYVEIPTDTRMSFAWNQDFTLELWVRTTDSTTEHTLVQRKRSDDGLLYSLSLFEGVPLFQLTTTTDSYAIVKGYETIADGTWHHIACVRDAGALKLYVDGDLVDELLPEARIAGAGGGDLSSDEPTYLGGAEEARKIMGGLVDAVYHIGESIEFRMRIADGTGTPVTDASPSLLFIHYDYAGRKLSSGLIGRLNYNPDEEEYVYSLDTSAYEEGVYDFFLISGDGSQERLQIMLLEVE